MQRDFAQLGNASFDLLIVGGGISGAALAWDATLRGLKVALVDKGDFGGATSSATSKLIHGGLRYLKNAEFGLVRESLRERRILQTIAPHLVRPVPFLIPTYRRGGNRKWMIRMGMIAYDLLSFDRGRHADPEQRLPRHRMLSPRQVIELEPGVGPEGLTGGAIYYDCQCDPDRLTLEFILGAAGRGARVVNYARVESMECSQGFIGGIHLRDILSGQKAVVTARMVVNVAGPWADQIDLLCGTGDEVTLRRSKGIHLITRTLSSNHALVLRTSQGGHFFIIPWRGRSLIGTTDTEYSGDPDRLSVLDQDVQDFLAEINRACPSASLAESDVLYRYVGVRPLVDQETQVYKASRKYEIVDHHDRVRGFISAVGGKYTTSRNLARKITDTVLQRLERARVACQTDRELLPGGVGGPFSKWVRLRLDGDRSGLARDVLTHLLWTYGARCDQVTALVGKDPALGERVAAGRPEILAQVAFAIENEMACTLCDVLVRRTGIGTLGHPGEQALNQIAALAQNLLGWTPEKTEREKASYLNKIKGFPESIG